MIFPVNLDFNGPWSSHPDDDPVVNSESFPWEFPNCSMASRNPMAQLSDTWYTKKLVGGLYMVDIYIYMDNLWIIYG